MLCFPIVADRLVFLVISRLALLQLGISVCAFWPYFLYDHTDWIVTLGIILFCWLSVLAIDFLVFLVSELIGTLISSALVRSEEHTSELQSLLTISYAVFCLKKSRFSRKAAESV